MVFILLFPFGGTSDILLLVSRLFFLLHLVEGSECLDAIDMVINIGELRAKNYDYVLNEIKEIKAACGDKILKVIIETCLLTDEEKIKMGVKKADVVMNLDEFRNYLSDVIADINEYGEAIKCLNS